LLLEKGDDMNFSLPNPAEPQDITNAILQSLSGQQFPAPGGTAASSPNTGATTQTYQAVLKVNGAVVPGVTFSTTTGPSTLSASAFNTVTWGIAFTGLPSNATWDIYRTVGGSTQGRIAVGLPSTVTSIVDIGLTADGTTAPAFNTSGTLGFGIQEQVVTLTGTADAITIPTGQVWINSSGVDATTLANPIAGAASAGGMDGCVLTIFALTAHAHTVTTGTNGVNGADHIITFTAATLNYVTLLAKNGSWYVKGSLNASIS
jgi:hypothetical protein